MTDASFMHHIVKNRLAPNSFVKERLTAFPVKSQGSNSPFTGRGCGLCRSDTHYEGIIVLHFDSLGAGMFLMRASWCTNTLSFQTPHLCKAQL